MAPNPIILRYHFGNFVHKRVNPIMINGTEASVSYAENYCVNADWTYRLAEHIMIGIAAVFLGHPLAVPWIDGMLVYAAYSSNDSRYLIPISSAVAESVQKQLVWALLLQWRESVCQYRKWTAATFMIQHVSEKK